MQVSIGTSFTWLHPLPKNHLYTNPKNWTHRRRDPHHQVMFGCPCWNISGACNNTWGGGWWGYTSQKYQFPMICSFSKFKEVQDSKWFPHVFSWPFSPSNRLACFAPVLHIEFPDGTTLISCEVGLQIGSRAMNIIDKRALHISYIIILYIVP